MGYDKRYLEGIDHFNKQNYFEAHESWEELWNESYDKSREFIQGLIQVATAMHHMQIQNMRGARILHQSGHELLEPFGDVYMGLDIKEVLLNFDRALAGILDVPFEKLSGRGGTGGPLRVDLTSDRVFKISLKDVN